MDGKTNAGVFNPHNLKLYTYTRNNPVNLVDADGNAFFVPFLIILAKEVGSEVIEQTTGIPMPTVKNAVKYSGKAVAKQVAKKPIAKLSDKEFLTEVATRAEKKVGGSGRVAGTKKHTYAKKLSERYQKMSGQRKNLEFEKSFKNKSRTYYGDKGSSRPDVFDENSGIVYDYKFVKKPGRGISSAQQNKNLKNVPEVTNQVEINPVKN